MSKNQFPKISNQELERMDRVLGLEVEARDPFNRYITFDNIRHFAHGIGDINPLYSDEEYANSTIWGRPVAPPSFLFSCFGRGAPQGLKGIHAMWAGVSFEIHRPLTAGIKIFGTVALTGMEPKSTKFAARSILQEHTYTFRDLSNNILANVREWHMRTERDTARKRNKHENLRPATYTPSEIEKIYSEYDKEIIRGGNPRYWDDVTVGEKLAPVIKGPLRVTDNVAWKIGWGFRPFTYAHKLGVEYYKKHPMAYITNDSGIPDTSERVHWDPQFAQSVGVPSSYDFGPQRVSWLCQVLTNWMGDEGFIHSFWSEVRRFNLVGDTHWLEGKVSKKEKHHDKYLVTIELWGKDQRQEQTITGGATVELPLRS